MTETPAGAKTKGGRGSRRLSREFVLRALYSRALNGSSLAELKVEAHDGDDFRQANQDFFASLLEGVLQQTEALDVALQPCLDRDFEQLSPVERAALQIGAYELIHSLEVPYRVAINEAVELTKRYGGTDGHKYVNGVLDKLAQTVRRTEIESR
jgi:N utilization substance protein B